MNADLRVGVITRTHGIRGEVKVYPTTDSPLRFNEIEEVMLKNGPRKERLRIQEARYFKNLVILKFEGIDSMNDAELLRGGELYIDRSQGEELSENEYYIADIIGMEVVTEEGEPVGQVKDVLETGANDVYLVKREGKKDLMLPAIRDCIRGVDIENNRMTVHILDGLADL